MNTRSGPNWSDRRSTLIVGGRRSGRDLNTCAGPWVAELATDASSGTARSCGKPVERPGCPSLVASSTTMAPRTAAAPAAAEPMARRARSARRLSGLLAQAPLGTSGPGTSPARGRSWRPGRLCWGTCADVPPGPSGWTGLRSAGSLTRLRPRNSRSFYPNGPWLSPENEARNC